MKVDDSWNRLSAKYHGSNSLKFMNFLCIFEIQESKNHCSLILIKNAKLMNLNESSFTVYYSINL